MADTPQDAPRTHGSLAPGRYCLKTCYCGQCPHYVPMVRVRDARQTAAYLEKLGRAAKRMREYGDESRWQK